MVRECLIGLRDMLEIDIGFISLLSAFVLVRVMTKRQTLVGIGDFIGSCIKIHTEGFIVVPSLILEALASLLLLLALVVVDIRALLHFIVQ